EDGLSVTDLQADAEQFYDDVDLLEQFELDFPVVHLGDKGLVPVALSEITAPSAPPFRFAARLWRYGFPILPMRDLLSEEMRRGKARLGDAATTLSPPDARKTFVSRASEFLASRFAGHRMLVAGGPPGEPPPSLTMPKFIGGPRTQVTGCLFSVHTNSP